MNFSLGNCVSLPARNPVTTFNNLFCRKRKQCLRVFGHVLLSDYVCFWNFIQVFSSLNSLLCVGGFVAI